MNILVVCQYYYPEQFKINDICEDLVKQGHQVTVLTGIPNYPDGIIPEEYQKGKKRKEKINGVNVIRTYEMARGKGKAKLMANYLSYMVSASLEALTLSKEFDIVYIFQLSPVIMAIPAIIYKAKNKKKLFLYCLDLWPESLKAMNIQEDSLIFKIIHRLSKWIYKKCDHIGVTSRPFEKYLVNINGISKEKISYLPQHAEGLYASVNGKFIENECVDFLFAGNIGQVQDIDCILKAANEIKHRDGFKIHLVGDGSYMENVKNLIQEFSIEDKVVLHGRHPVEEMPRFYELADAYLLTLKGDSNIGMTIPGKLQGYMAAGKPIFAAINGATEGVIQEANCGVCVPAGAYRELASAMEQYIDNQEMYRAYGKNAYDYFNENFTLEAYQKQLLSRLKQLV